MLIVIHTKELGFLRSTELEARDKVDNLGDDGGHNEGVG